MKSIPVRVDDESTTQPQHRVCPGRKTDAKLSPVGNLLSIPPAVAADSYAGSVSQLLDTTLQMSDAILGIAIFSAATASLSVSIYKICTSPSTGNVDNVAARGSPDPRKPLSGAVFRGPCRFPS
jgi:hypothetical protein